MYDTLLIAVLSHKTIACPTIEMCQSNNAGLHLDFIYTSINSDHEYDVLMTLRETLTSNLSIRTNPVVIRQNTGIGDGILHLFSAFFYPVLA